MKRNPGFIYSVGLRTAMSWIVSVAVCVWAWGDNTAQTDSIGTLRGAGSVSMNGAAQYSIPITVPPGVAGMTPSVSLEYSSDRGTGLAGRGWTISAGAQAIHRCNATKAQDPVAKEMTYTNADRLCLNGQRLVQTGGAVPYGIKGSSYRTEIASFQRIETDGDAGLAPDRFIVTQRDGTKLIFGEVPGGKDGRFKLLNSDVVRVWALSRVLDTESNYIDYIYNEDAATGEYDLAGLEYTGQVSSGKLPRYKVSFSYETRPDDVRDQYSAGYFMKNSRRLTSITTSLDQADIRSYSLAYKDYVQDSSGHSRLDTVTECVSDGEKCKAPITIDWNIGSSGWTNDGPLDSQNIGEDYQLGDWDGDGITDLFFPSSGSNSTWRISTGGESFAGNEVIDSELSVPTTSTSRHWFVDFDGDGMSDMLRFFSNSNGLSATARLSNAPSTSPAFGGVTQTGIDQFPDVRSYRLADADGDGLADFLYTKSDGNLYVRYNTGASFAAPSPTPAAQTPGPGFMQAGYGPDVFPQTSSIGVICCMLNLNNDGIPDLLVLAASRYEQGFINPTFFYATKWAFYRSTGTGYVLDTSFNEVPTDANLFDFIDVNGDGLDDITYVDQFGNNGFVRLNNGTHFLPETPLITTTGFGGVIGTQVIDYNNDGRQDRIVHSTVLGPQIYLSNGETLVADTSITTVPAIGASSLAADFTGNGSTDLILGASLEDGATPVYFEGVEACEDLWLDNQCQTVLDLPDPIEPPPTAPSISLWLNNTAQSDVVDKVTDGYGNVVDFSYGPMATSENEYSLDRSLVVAPHTRPAWGGRHIVTSVTYNDGTVDPTAPYAPRTYSIDYKYETALYDARGRGSLGFHKVKSIDSRTGFVTVRTYGQSHPLTGRLLSEGLYQSEGGLPIQETVNTWVKRPFGSELPQREFVYIDKQETDFFEFGGPSDGVFIRKVTSDPEYEYPPAGDLANVSLQRGYLLNQTTEIDTDQAGGDPEFWTTTVYTPNESTAAVTAWCLTLVDDVSVTRGQKVGNSSEVETRKMSYELDLPKCRVTKDTLLSDLTGEDAKYQAITSYKYDTRGNSAGSVLTGNAAIVEYDNGEPFSARMSRIEYDTDGQFPIRTISCYDDVDFDACDTAGGTAGNDPYVTLAWNYKFGRPTSVTGVLGQVSSGFLFDDFGRSSASNLSNGDGTETRYEDCPAGVTEACWVPSAVMRVVIARNTFAQGVKAIFLLDSFGRQVGQQVRNRSVIDGLAIVTKPLKDYVFENDRFLGI